MPELGEWKVYHHDRGGPDGYYTCVIYYAADGGQHPYTDGEGHIQKWVLHDPEPDAIVQRMNDIMHAKQNPTK